MYDTIHLSGPIDSSALGVVIVRLTGTLSPNIAFESWSGYPTVWATFYMDVNNRTPGREAGYSPPFAFYYFQSRVNDGIGPDGGPCPSGQEYAFCQATLMVQKDI